MALCCTGTGTVLSDCTVVVGADVHELLVSQPVSSVVPRTMRRKERTKERGTESASEGRRMTIRG